MKVSGTVLILSYLLCVKAQRKYIIFIFSSDGKINRFASVHRYKSSRCDCIGWKTVPWTQFEMKSRCIVYNIFASVKTDFLITNVPLLLFRNVTNNVSPIIWYLYWYPISTNVKHSFLKYANETVGFWGELGWISTFVYHMRSCRVVVRNKVHIGYSLNRTFLPTMLH